MVRDAVARLDAQAEPRPRDQDRPGHACLLFFHVVNLFFVNLVGARMRKVLSAAMRVRGGADFPRPAHRVVSYNFPVSYNFFHSAECLTSKSAAD